MLPRSIRQNNPGNLRPSNPPWNGTIGESGGFAVFDTMANGIRALCKQLMVYQDGRRKIFTIRRAIETWAPPEDHNDTNAYISAVCHLLEVGPDDRLDFHTEAFLYWMVVAIGSQESGGKAFQEGVTDADIDAGIAAALA